MSKPFWLVYLLLFLAACSPILSNLKPTEGEASIADEYAVYEAILQSNWPDQAQIVVADTTDIHTLQDIASKIDGNLSALEKDTLAHFLEVNNQEYPVEDHFQPGDHVVLLSQSGRNNIFGQNLEESWQRFYEKYPDSQGLLAFSRVGFSSERTQALVYFGNEKASLNGAGYVVLLAYENNTWVVIKQLMIWIV